MVLDVPHLWNGKGMSCTIYESFYEWSLVQTNTAANVLIGLLEVLEDENEFFEEADGDVILFSAVVPFIWEF